MRGATVLGGINRGICLLQVTPASCTVLSRGSSSWYTLQITPKSLGLCLQCLDQPWVL